MFYANSHGQPVPFRQVYKSYVAQSAFLPPAMLLLGGLVIGIVSELFGLPGERLALNFISNAADPVAMVQVFFLAVAYATGPLCLMLSRENFDMWVRHLNANVQFNISELASVFASKGDDVLLLLSSSNMPVMRPARLALAATPTTNHIPGESPQLE